MKQEKNSFYFCSWSIRKTKVLGGFFIQNFIQVILVCLAIYVSNILVDDGLDIKLEKGRTLRSSNNHSTEVYNTIMFCKEGILDGKNV